jgi:hypothetical protein
MDSANSLIREKNVRFFLELDRRGAINKAARASGISRHWTRLVELWRERGWIEKSDVGVYVYTERGKVLAEYLQRLIDGLKR